MPAAAIHRIRARALSLGVPPDHVALAEGHIAEETFYRALALSLGLPLLNSDDLHQRLSAQHLRVPETLSSGIAVLEPGETDTMSGARRFVIAPRGHMIGSLAAAGPALRQRIALTSPSHLGAAVRRAGRHALSQHVSHGLSQRSPALSAEGKASRGQLLTIALVILLLSFFGTLEPLATLVIAGLVLGPVFLVLATVRMAAVFEPDPSFSAPRRALLSDAALPVTTVLVPLYREAAIVTQLIAALVALDYPAAKLDIKLLVEADDLSLHRALKACRLPPHISVVTVPWGEPRTKPRALNAGLLEARGSLLAIYDAEDVPDPGQLRLAATLMQRAPAHVAALQARLVIDNAGDSLLSRVFALEYAGLFDVINPGLVRSGLPFLLGGTSNHFRTAILRKVGGWDAWNVTEDADLAIRLVREGYTLGDCPSITWEEAPARLGGWMRQRRRWMKGFMQSAATHSRAPVTAMRQTGILQFVTLSSLSLGTVISAMLYPLFWVLTLMAIRQGDVLAPVGLGQVVASSLALTLFAAGLLGMFGPPLLGAIRRRAWGLLWVAPLLPFYALLISVAAWWALLDWMFSPFHWHKTEHGLALSSLRGEGSRLSRQMVSAASATPPPLSAVSGQD
jgi:glycosyltransferase XagB